MAASPTSPAVVGMCPPAMSRMNCTPQEAGNEDESPCRSRRSIRTSPVVIKGPGRFDPGSVPALRVARYAVGRQDLLSAAASVPHHVRCRTCHCESLSDGGSLWAKSSDSSPGRMARYLGLHAVHFRRDSSLPGHWNGARPWFCTRCGCHALELVWFS